MAYATVQDLIDRWSEEDLVELAPERDGDAWGESYDPAKVQGALADAQAEIDGYLSARYRLPLEQVPAQLTALAVDIARWRLAVREDREDVRKRYEQAVARLQKIARGEISLGIAPAPASGGAPRVRPGRRAFGDDGLRGF